MKTLLQLLLLTIFLGCGSFHKIVNPEASKINLLTGDNHFVDDRDIFLVKDTLTLKFIFLPYNSKGLKPAVYSYGSGRLRFTERSYAKKNDYICYQWYEITVVPKNEVFLLFIFEGETDNGDKKLIRIIKDVKLAN